MERPTRIYDVVVIGAGVCGAVAAWKLARKGASVLILEAGPSTADRRALVGSFARRIARSPYA